MRKRKTVLLLIGALFLLLGMIFTSLNIPEESQAGPLAGFTPTPEPPDPSPPQTEAPVDDDDVDNEEERPTDYVDIIIDRCDLTCSANFGHLDQANLEPLASASSDDKQGALLVSTDEQEPPIEVQVRVQLVHEGSGWIAEGVISNLQSTRFSVPYPGQWQLFLIAQPEIISTQPIDNPEVQAAIAASFNGTPTPMGMVEANTATPQYVRCPIDCVLEPPPILPETGTAQGQDKSLMAALILGGVIAMVVGLSRLLPPSVNLFD